MYVVPSHHSQLQRVSSIHVKNLEKWSFYNWQHSSKYSREATHQNASASHSNDGIDGTIVCLSVPATFRKLHAILVQEEMLINMILAQNPIGREGDLVVSRSEAGEDARVDVEHSISSAWTSRIIEVGQEGFKGHSLGRCDVIMPPGRYDHNCKPARSRRDGFVRALLETISFLKEDSFSFSNSSLSSFTLLSSVSSLDSISLSFASSLVSIFISCF